MSSRSSSSRSKYSHFLIGSATSVLKDDFIQAFESDEQFDVNSWLPFSGKLKLPSQMDVLKLILFLRDEAGKNNHGVRNGDIYKSVSEVVQKYWAKAGFSVKSRIERDVEKIHQEYKRLPSVSWPSSLPYSDWRESALGPRHGGVLGLLHDSEGAGRLADLASYEVGGERAF